MQTVNAFASLFSLYSVVVVALVFVALLSVRRIGPTEVGLVMKRFSLKKLPGDNPVAFNGEAGYQADLLQAGLRFKLWPVYSVEKFPLVQVPAGEIGVVIAQVGEPTPIGAKSAIYKKEFRNFSDLRSFVKNGGQKGVQRPVLNPGTVAAIHPVGFLVITKNRVYGHDLQDRKLALNSFAVAPEKPLEPGMLAVTRIEPKPGKDGRLVDMVGIVTTFDGDPLSSGEIASRLGGFKDIEAAMADSNTKDDQLVEILLGTKNKDHNNYQDFQAFLDAGGRIGVQYDPLLYGAYNLNPFLVSVELVPMLVVEQGQVAVVKSYVGLVTEDTSGLEFKHGSLVRPGRRGIWQEPLRTGKYAINPHCYQPEIVPTSILTLNWAEANSKAHDLDKELKQIDAKSREGFEFAIDLQVQIHVPDRDAPKVISAVGTMKNLVNEVLQAAVGNYFRDKIQALRAVEFIQTRQQVQEASFEYIRGKLRDYFVETKGVYIQDVVLPEKLVEVLKAREIANQQIDTFVKEKEAEEKRVEMEKARGMANAQGSLAISEVSITIKTNEATARKAEAAGEAFYTAETGRAKAAEVEAVGLAQAKAYAAQVEALGGGDRVAAVRIVTSLAERRGDIVPQVQVTGSGSAQGGTVDALMGLAVTEMLSRRNGHPKDEPASKERSA